MVDTTAPIPTTTPIEEAKSQFEWQLKWFPRFLLLPTMFYLFMLTVFPLLYSLFISLFKTDTTGQNHAWVGLGNYGDLLGSGEFWYSMFITLVITVVAVTLEVLLGIAIAVLLHQRLRGMGIFRLIIYIPMMLSPLVIGYFWKYMLDPSFGVVGWFFDVTIGRVFGLPTPQWFSDPWLATTGIILVDLWQWTPFVVLLVTAGLQTVPPALYEAATLDRASWWMQFRRITMPFLVTPLLVAVLFRSIDTIKIFDTVYILTGGQPGDLTATLSVLVYKRGFTYSQIGQAAAFSWLIVILVNVVTTVVLRYVTRSRNRARSILS